MKWEGIISRILEKKQERIEKQKWNENGMWTSQQSLAIFQPTRKLSLCLCAIFDGQTNATTYQTFPL
jgi:hypothetical protein